MPEEKNPQLDEIAGTLEHSVAASAATTAAVKDLETPLEAIVKNTTPKPPTTQKVSIEGAEIITIKGEKGDTPTEEELVPIINKLIPPLIPAPIKGDTGPAFVFEDFTPKQLEDLKVKGDKGDSVTTEDLVPVIKDLIPAPIKGDSPTDEQLISLIKDLIPAPIPGKKGDRGSADTPAQILEKIRTLAKGKGLQYEDIQNAPSLETLQRISSKTYSMRELDDVSIEGIQIGQSVIFDGKNFIPFTPAASGNQIYGEVIGSVGSANFTLAHNPIAGTVRIYRGGAYQQGGGGDYTMVGAAGTLTSVLQDGEILLADYNY